MLGVIRVRHHARVAIRAQASAERLVLEVLPDNLLGERVVHYLRLPPVGLPVAILQVVEVHVELPVHLRADASLVASIHRDALLQPAEHGLQVGVPVSLPPLPGLRAPRIHHDDACLVAGDEVEERPALWPSKLFVSSK